MRARRELERAQAILEHLLAQPPEAREPELERLCGQEHELARIVRDLLERAARLGSFLERPALGPNFRLLPARAPEALGAQGDPIGQSIGPYRLLGLLGSGGMAHVYLAEPETPPAGRRVALKLIRRGMDSDEVLLRFRREQEALAALEHANIARLFDAGLSASGQPYIVMEYVIGAPIDLHCDRHRLGLEARLELFREVCAAVRHAHRRLVVHRDLKPRNILVTPEGRPKLLDFGIAKVLDPARAGDATAAAQRWFTPEYASPEQLAGAPVTTASDVYSLGVILYRLLCGLAPHRETPGHPPEPPSRALARASEGERRSAAELRGTSSERLVRRLRGDLDTIALAALQPDLERRYASVEQLVLDLERHGRGLPVSAHRDTFAYRASKFIWRHALACALSAAIVALSLAAGGLVAWQARRARFERDAAVAARHEAEALTWFWLNMLESAKPSGIGELTVRDLLDSASRELEARLASEPRARARLQETIGGTFFALGAYREAEHHLRAALEARRADPGAESLEAAKIENDLARVLIAVDALDEAGALLAHALDVYQRAHGFDSERSAQMLGNLGVVRYQQRRFDEALECHETALDIRRRLPAGNELEVAESLNNIGAVRSMQGDWQTAHALYEEALALRRTRLAPHSPLVAKTVVNIGMVWAQRGDFEQAERMFREGLGLMIQGLGHEHPDVALTRHFRARALVEIDRCMEAIEELRAAVGVYQKTVPRGDGSLVAMQADLAGLLLERGELEESSALFDAMSEATADEDPEGRTRQLVRFLEHRLRAAPTQD